MYRPVLASLLVLVAACGDDPQVFLDAGADAAPSCGALDLATCRRTAGCVADLCPACNCDLSYRGCLPAGQTPAACPALGCPSPECCQEPGDCASGACLSPGEAACGGACNPQPAECTIDRDCAPMPTGAAVVLVCDPVPCSCSAAHACVPGCATDDDCGEAEVCTTATGRCRPATCSATAPCPADFDCVDGACHRRACANDLVCDHFCVEGVCRGDGLGTCQLPVP